MAVKELKRRKARSTAKTTSKKTVKPATKKSSVKRSTPPSAEKSREKIINAALELFAENGYNGASIRQIAAKAGISLGLMYNYFEGKEGLLHYIFTQGFNEIQAAFEVDTSLKPAAQLESIINKNLQLLIAKTEFYRLFYSLKLQPAALSNLSAELQQWEQLILQKLTDIFSKMKIDNAAIEAQLFVSTIEGIGHKLVLNPDNYETDKLTLLIINHYQKPVPAEAIEEKVIEKELSEIGKKLKALSKPIAKKVKTAEIPKEEAKLAPVQGQLF